MQHPTAGVCRWCSKPAELEQIEHEECATAVRVASKNQSQVTRFKCINCGRWYPAEILPFPVFKWSKVKCRGCYLTGEPYPDEIVKPRPRLGERQNYKDDT